MPPWDNGTPTGLRPVPFWASRFDSERGRFVVYPEYKTPSLENRTLVRFYSRGVFFKNTSFKPSETFKNQINPKPFLNF